MSEQLTIEQRVANGVEWLDNNRPSWIAEVNPKTLAFESPCNCVLGQLFGNYWDAPMVPSQRFPGEEKDAEREQNAVALLGFNAHWQEGGWREELPECELLTDEWRRVITARRETAADLKARSGAVTDA
jgi:hypothetical protein